MTTNWQGTERQGSAAPTDFSHLIRAPKIPAQPPTPPAELLEVEEEPRRAESTFLPAPSAVGEGAGVGEDPAISGWPGETDAVDLPVPAAPGVEPTPTPEPATGAVEDQASRTLFAGFEDQDWTNTPLEPIKGSRATQLQAKTTSAALAAPTEGMPALVRKLSFGLIRPQVGAAELLAREHVASTQRQFARPMTIVVANPKGGVGTTVCTVGLGGTFGHFRGGSVVAWDNNESYGTLDVRTMSNGGTNTVVDLLNDMDRFNRVDARAGDLGGYLRAQPNASFDVLASDQDSSRMEEIGDEEFEQIHALMSRFRDLIIIDSGNNSRRPNFLAAIKTCDQLVIPTNLSHDSIRAVSLLTDQLDAMGRNDLVRNAVVIVTGPGAEGQDTAARTQYLDNLASWCRAVVHIPHDPHIGQRSIIDYHLLAPATRTAFLEATDAIAQGLTTKEHNTNTQGATP